MNNKWDLLQRELAEWNAATFPGNTIEQRLTHLKDELDEIIEDPTDRLEWADAMTLLLHSAHKAGFTMEDLYIAVQDKFAINKQRKWGTPDSRGVSNHIPED